MSVLFIILGILMMMCGFSCLFTPLLTFMSAGYFIVILVLVYGVFGIVRAIANKKFGVNFAFSILSVIFGAVVLFFPSLMLLSDSVLLYLTAAWFILMGIVTIYAAVMLKKSGSKVWVAELIFGILAILVGLFSFFQPMFMAISIGVLISVFFIETGITMLITGIAND